MNLIDQIVKNASNPFTAKPVTSNVPSFSTPQAPRTQSYVQPQAPVKVARTRAPGYEDVVDTTQSPLFKATQWAANMITSAPGKLRSSVEEEKKAFDEQMKQERLAFISDMQKKGYDKNAIFTALDSLQEKWEFDFKPWFLSRVKEAWAKRLDESIWTTERIAGQWLTLKSAVTAPLAYAWDVVWAGTDVLWAALQPAIEPVIKWADELTGWAVSTWLGLASDWYKGFKKENPNLADAVEGIANVGSLAPVPLVNPIANVAGKWIKSTGKAIVRWAETVAPKMVQWVKTWIKATGEWVGKVTKSIVSQQSWLWTEAIESILKRPELQWKIRSWELSAARTLEEARSSIDALREWFRETGKMYDIVRKSNVVVPKNEAKQVLLSQLESEGLSTGWKLNLVDLPVKDRWAITQALKYIDEYGDSMTPQNALSIRQKLDDLINYKSDVGSNGQRIVQGLRAKYDEFLGQKLPWLKDIDTKYAPERQFWEWIRKDIYKADWTLKDNALSVVSNITNKGNEARLARMEKILPWIGEKVKALKAFDDVQAASGIKVWTYWRAATTGAIAMASIPVALATWVATHPAVVSRVLEWIWLASQKIKAIISKWKNITKEEASIIQKAVANTPKSKVEWIINNLAYDPKTNKLTSKTLTKNGNSNIRPVSIGNKWVIGKMEQVKKPSSQVTPKTIVKPKKLTK